MWAQQWWLPTDEDCTYSNIIVGGVSGADRFIVLCSRVCCLAVKDASASPNFTEDRALTHPLALGAVLHARRRACPRFSLGHAGPYWNAVSFLRRTPYWDSVASMTTWLEPGEVVVYWRHL